MKYVVTFMKLSITLIFFIHLLFFQSIIGQKTINGPLRPAIIQDKDGWTNVRVAPNSQSKVIHKINKESIFWYAHDSYAIRKESWIPIVIPRSGCDANNYGYIHRSRIKTNPEQDRSYLAKMTEQGEREHFDGKLCLLPSSKISCDEYTGNAETGNEHIKVCRHPNGIITLKTSKSYEGKLITKYPLEKFTFKEVLDYYMIYHGAFSHILGYAEEIGAEYDGLLEGDGKYEDYTVKFDYHKIFYSDNFSFEKLYVKNGYIVFETTSYSI